MSETVVRPLEELYNFKDQAAILKFLAKKPDLQESLLQINTRLRQYFPEGPFFLEVAPDAGANNELRLVISVYPAGTATEALTKFSQFKDDWWFKKYAETNQRIVVFVEHPDFAASGDPWDAIESMIGAYDGPSDWSAQHDHYIYGTPKEDEI